MDRLGGTAGQDAAWDDDAPAGDASSPAARGRDSLLLVATIRIGDDQDPVDVRIRNLSTGGMMVEHADRVATDTPVKLELRGIGRVTGKVAWCTEGRLGIALDQPIDPKRARKPVAGGTKTPFYAKSVAETMRRR